VSILQIFQSGTRPDSNGVERTFTDDQLDEIVGSYNPAVYRAPMFEGHDESKPNKGLIGQLKRIGDSLFAVPQNIDPAFKEDVNSGKFPSVSVRFYSPTEKSNPTPGKWALRHVGFPQIPAVKGMMIPQFSEEKGGELEIEFAEKVQFMDYDCFAQAQLWRGLREFMIGKFSLEEVDKVLPNYLIDELMISATKDEIPMEIPMTDAPVNYAENTAELERLRAENAKLKKEQQETQFSEFLDKLGGKVTPGEKPGLIALMTSLSGTGEVAFSEAGATKNQSALDVFKKSLENREIKIDFNESPEAIEITSDPNALAKEIKDYMFAEQSKGNQVTYTQAMNHLTGGKK
jgi:hypothetical protein